MKRANVTRLRYLSVEGSNDAMPTTEAMHVEVKSGVEKTRKFCECRAQCGTHPAVRCLDRARSMAKIGEAVAIAVCSECAKAIVARAFAALLGG